MSAEDRKVEPNWEAISQTLTDANILYQRALTEFNRTHPGYSIPVDDLRTAHDEQTLTHSWLDDKAGIQKSVQFASSGPNFTDVAIAINGWHDTEEEGKPIRHWNFLPIATVDQTQDGTLVSEFTVALETHDKLLLVGVGLNSRCSKDILKTHYSK